MAEGQGVADIGLYSIVAGFDANNGQPYLFSNHHQLAEFKQHHQTGNYIVLATDTNAVRPIADKLAPGFLVGGRLQTDAWGFEVIKASAALFPIEIGFPADFFLLRKGASPLQKRILSAGLGRPSDPSWRIAYPG